MRVAVVIARHEIREQFRPCECSIALPQLGAVGTVDRGKVGLPAKGAQAHLRSVKVKLFAVLGQAYRSAGAAVGFPKGRGGVVAGGETADSVRAPWTLIGAALDQR